MKFGWIRRTKRRYLVAGLAALTALTVSGVAIATHFTYEHKASVYRGSGSDTSYDLMTNLDKLYNQSVGCKSIHPVKANQTLDLTCQSEDASDPTKANYDHDVFLEHYPLGSSFGISQLQNQGLTNTPQVDFARSSRKPKVGDHTQLRFVGYARDALSWACFKGVAGAGCNGMPVDGSGKPNLSQTEIRGIYNCTITNWNQVGGANVPIKVYQAQSGSGTRATWDEFLTYVPTDACATPVFENDANLVPAGDREEAIMYYSYGRYNQQTPPGHGTTLGRVDTVLADDNTVGLGTFPFSRLIYNVIRHSYATTPSYNANQEVRDYMDVGGFLCKGPGQHVTNPKTGNNYRTDIETAIRADGFVPLPFGGPTGPAPLTFSSYCRVTAVPTA